jgi:hypothetical protein
MEELIIRHRRDRMDMREAVQFYVQSHYFELQRKDALNASVSISVAVLGIVAGALAYYLEHEPRGDPFGPLFLAFITLWATGLLLWCCGVYYCVRQISGHRYNYLPKCGSIEEYRAGLKTYYDANAGVAPGFHDEFYGALLDWAVRTSDQNQASNLEKARLGVICDRYVIASSLSAALAAIPFYFLGGFS